MENKQEITVSVKYSNDGSMESNQNNNPKPQKPPKVKKQKQIDGICPYCKTHLQTNKGEDKKCPQCGATVTYAEFKNQHAVLQTTETGKKKFNFINLLKKWWFWVAILFIVSLIVGIVSPSVSTPSASEPQKSFDAQTQTQEQEKIDQDVLYGKYTTVSLPDNTLSLKVVSVTDTHNISPYHTGNYYLIIGVMVKNTDTSDYQGKQIVDPSFFTVSSGEKSYYHSTMETYQYGQNTGKKVLASVQSLSRNESNTYYLVFEVTEPNATGQYVLTFDPGLFKSTAVKIKLY